MAKVAVDVDWADLGQWRMVYQPSSDTFFLCDGIAAVAGRFKDASLVVEVGSGSGYVTAYTSRYLKSLGKQSVHFTTDINRSCCLKTWEICERNGVLVAPICDVFAASVRGPIDVMIFNPPYVETDTCELEQAQSERGIAASWAGGEDGAVVIYAFLRFVAGNPRKFAPDFFVVLLVSALNRPARLRKFCRQIGLNFTIVLERKCEGESLKIAVISW
jgi:release factor glutamine methyltransferase